MSHCGFYLRFLMANDLEIFSCVCWPLVYLVLRNMYSNAMHIFYLGYLSLLDCFKNSLYRLDIIALLGILLANIASHFVIVFLHS